MEDVHLKCGHLPLTSQQTLEALVSFPSTCPPPFPGNTLSGVTNLFLIFSSFYLSVNFVKTVFHLSPLMTMQDVSYRSLITLSGKDNCRRKEKKHQPSGRARCKESCQETWEAHREAPRASGQQWSEGTQGEFLVIAPPLPQISARAERRSVVNAFGNFRVLAEAVFKNSSCIKSGWLIPS